MTELEKFRAVNLCETAKDLTKAIRLIADPATGKVQGRVKEFDSQRMSGYVSLVVNEGAPANLLTREFGIRQQAIYLRYCTEHGI
jgi:hypothetical protein